MIRLQNYEKSHGKGQGKVREGVREVVREGVREKVMEGVREKVMEGVTCSVHQSRNGSFNEKLNH